MWVTSRQDLKEYVSGSAPFSLFYWAWFVCLYWCSCSITLSQLCVCECVFITPNFCIFADHLLYSVSFRDCSPKSESIQHTIQESISTLTLSKHLQWFLKMQCSLRYTNIWDIRQCNCTYWSGFLLNVTAQLLLTDSNVFILSCVQ